MLCFFFQIHRDIKAENVVIEVATPQSDFLSPSNSDDSTPATSSGNSSDDSSCDPWMRAKLIDFGLAKYVQSGRTSTPCGTFGYIAPEILYVDINACEYTTAADMWSFGSLLYLLLTGSLSAELKTPPIEQKDLEIEYPEMIWNSIPKPARECVQACLNVDPATRVTAAEFLAMPWFQDSSDDGSEDSKDEAKCCAGSGCCGSEEGDKDETETGKKNAGGCDGGNCCEKKVAAADQHKKFAGESQDDKGESSDNRKKSAELRQPKPVNSIKQRTISQLLSEYDSFDQHQENEGSSKANDKGADENDPIIKFLKTRSPTPPGWYLPRILRTPTPNAFDFLSENDQRIENARLEMKNLLTEKSGDSAEDA
ncbi:hypothetical protein HK100_004840 [Physocladia obscura]|uniref:Protein kinase domain-containing protein n=1 Tax=Physocladia obscura TaxID=109957 RepID=A0AAD5T6T3_9FUNG|nr:hypothetical protein HK100_004840 [Physocladia obscura]